MRCVQSLRVYEPLDTDSYKGTHKLGLKLYKYNSCLNTGVTTNSVTATNCVSLYDIIELSTE